MKLDSHQGWRDGPGNLSSPGSMLASSESPPRAASLASQLFSTEGGWLGSDLSTSVFCDIDSPPQLTSQCEQWRIVIAPAPNSFWLVSKMAGQAVQHQLAQRRDLGGLQDSAARTAKVRMRGIHFKGKRNDLRRVFDMPFSSFVCIPIRIRALDSVEGFWSEGCHNFFYGSDSSVTKCTSPGRKISPKIP